MANPVGGHYQQLLLKGADNGRLQAQHSRTETRASLRDGERAPFRPGRGRPVGPSRPPPSVTPSARPSASQTSWRRSTSQPTAMIPTAWASRRSVTVIAKDVPSDASPWDIRQHFKQFGNVAWVEHLEALRNGFQSAKVRFEPPPTDASLFRQGEVKVGGTWCKIWLEIPGQRPEEHTLGTPSGGQCPLTMALGPELLKFGLLTRPTTFMPKKDVLTLDQEFALSLTADFRRQKLVIHFPLLVQGEKYAYRLDIKFGIIRNIHRMTADEGRSVIVISLADPPLARRKQSDSEVAGEAWADRRVWGEDELWQRVVDIRPGLQNPKRKPLSLDEEPDIIDIGRWTIYWLELNASGSKQWADIEAHLHEWNVRTKLGVEFTQVPNRKPDMWELLDDSPGSTGATSSWTDDLALLSRTDNSRTDKISLPFDVRYQLEVCVSGGILCEYNIEREFLAELLVLSRPDAFGLNRARLVLEYAADTGRPIYNPMDLFKDRGAMTYHPTTLHIPNYCALVRKVIVTPTRLYYCTPTVETNNRIVRRYCQVQDYFIRIQFIDELLDGRLRAGDVGRDDEVYTRVYRAMTEGVRMGKWHWELLAFGNSQIRESGAWLFCQTESHPGITCSSIRGWMGNFDHIETVAKYAARLGQCFSTTRLLHSIPSLQIVKIPDVEKDGYCFTDGVGKISVFLAHRVSESWKIPHASAFQVRIGGSKGVLVTSTDAKLTEVHIRPSQEKFPAGYNGLEIIRCSQFACATLNRQTITILSCLGVPDEVFINMMEAQISKYNAAMTDMDTAVELLTSYVDENMTTTTIASMVQSGFMHTNEPFVRTLLQLWRSWSYKALKEKARLVVEQGAFLLGCVDETGTLRGMSKATEGHKKIEQNQLPQIFLQVSDPKNRGAPKVITGLCIVGRNPSVHPGDIRVVEAVDVPQLRHLRDVVVFPLHGDRDIPSMCAGGDLDGDDFFVIWDPDLLPPKCEWSYPPMNYSAPKPPKETKPSTANHLATFFMLYTKNDRLALIAHAHLATADLEDEGAKSPKCLQLAELHSTAVDYVKTGVPAQWNKKLIPRKYPHFMEKPKSMSYTSTKVLGRLYDMVNREDFDNSEYYKLPFDARILKHFQLDPALLKEARKIKTQYDIAMRRIMAQLEIRTEFEVWTAFVLSKPRVGSDYKVQEKVGREAAGLKKQFRDLCLAAVERLRVGRDELAAGMYRVTWEETQIALHEAHQQHVRADGTVGLRRVTARSMPLISFPWLFHQELGKIALDAERVTGLDEVVAQPASGGKGKAPAGSSAVVAQELEFDLGEMEYARTSDGKLMHRGEILQLFRHSDDDEEGGFYYGQDVVSAVANPNSNDEGPGKASESEEAESISPSLLDLDAALGGEGGGSSSSSAASSTSQEGAVTPAASSPLKTASCGEPDIMDLLSSDSDAGFDLSPWLTPEKVYQDQQPQQGDEETHNIENEAETENVSQELATASFLQKNKSEEDQPNSDAATLFLAAQIGEAQGVASERWSKPVTKQAAVPKPTCRTILRSKATTDTTTTTAATAAASRRTMLMGRPTTNSTTSTAATAAFRRPASPSPSPSPPPEEFSPLKYIPIPAVTSGASFQYSSSSSYSSTSYSTSAASQGRSQSHSRRSRMPSHGYASGQRNGGAVSGFDTLAAVLARSGSGRGSFSSREGNYATAGGESGEDDEEGVEYDEEEVVVETDTVMDRAEAWFACEGRGVGSAE